MKMGFEAEGERMFAGPEDIQDGSFWEGLKGRIERG